MGSRCTAPSLWRLWSASRAGAEERTEHDKAARHVCDEATMGPVSQLSPSRVRRPRIAFGTEYRPSLGAEPRSLSIRRSDRCATCSRQSERGWPTPGLHRGPSSRPRVRRPRRAPRRSSTCSTRSSKPRFQSTFRSRPRSHSTGPDWSPGARGKKRSTGAASGVPEPATVENGLEAIGGEGYSFDFDARWRYRTRTYDNKSTEAPRRLRTVERPGVVLPRRRAMGRRAACTRDHADVRPPPQRSRCPGLRGRRDDRRPAPLQGRTRSASGTTRPGVRRPRGHQPPGQACPWTDAQERIRRRTGQPPEGEASARGAHREDRHRQLAAFRSAWNARPTAKDQGKGRWECPAQAGKLVCANCPVPALLPRGTPKVENMKNPSSENVRRGWCRVVGIVKTSILAACAVAATNIRLCGPGRRAGTSPTSSPDFPCGDGLGGHSDCHRRPTRDFHPCR